MVVKAALILSLLLAGCASVPIAVEDPREVWCSHAEPRRDATMDTPRAELDDINAHNLQGMRWCGWAP